MTEFSSCLSSLVFSRTRAGRSFLFQESLNRKRLPWSRFVYKQPRIFPPESRAMLGSRPLQVFQSTGSIEDLPLQRTGQKSQRIQNIHIRSWMGGVAIWRKSVINGT